MNRKFTTEQIKALSLAELKELGVGQGEGGSDITDTAKARLIDELVNAGAVEIDDSAAAPDATPAAAAVPAAQMKLESEVDRDLYEFIPRVPIQIQGWGVAEAGVKQATYDKQMFNEVMVGENVSWCRTTRQSKGKAVVISEFEEDAFGRLVKKAGA